MNREILFRAKCFGNWRYGSYVHFDKKPTHNCYNCNYKDFIVTNEEDDEHYYPISELSSLGQYTGLKDKNGKKIFEGDIVHLKGDGFGGSEVGVDYHKIVSFNNGSFCLSADEGVHFPIDNYFHGLDDWDVIGNVHDNLELIK